MKAAVFRAVNARGAAAVEGAVGLLWCAWMSKEMNKNNW